MLPLCPRCGKVEKDRHVCTGNLNPTADARKSARRQARRAAETRTTVEVTEKTWGELNEIREVMAGTAGKTSVTHDEVVQLLLGYYRNRHEDNG